MPQLLRGYVALVHCLDADDAGSAWAWAPPCLHVLAFFNLQASAGSHAIPWPHALHDVLVPLWVEQHLLLGANERTPAATLPQQPPPIHARRKDDGGGLSGVLSALDFAAPRSASDAEILYQEGLGTSSSFIVARVALHPTLHTPPFSHTPRPYRPRTAGNRASPR